MGENLGKYFLRKYLLIFVLVKLQALSLQPGQKNQPHYRYISSNFSISRKPLLQNTPQGKK